KVGLVITLVTPNPFPKPFVNVVFPAPKSPSIVITNECSICSPKLSAKTSVSSSDSVITTFFIFSPTLNECSHLFLKYYLSSLHKLGHFLILSLDQFL